MRINNNLMAMNTHRAMGMVQGAQSKSMEKLSSGYRINRAGDDAAGLAISEKMRGQIRGLSQASRNSQDAISLIQTSEGALNETHAILQRMRELAVQSASDTNTGDDRGKIQSEIDQLTSEINRIGNTTEFNTMKLLDGSRSETSRELTSTVRTVVASTVKTANYAQGIAAVGGMADTDVFDGGVVTVAAGGELANADAGAGNGSGTITVKLGADTTTFTIDIDYQGSAGTTFTSTDTVSFTEGTDFTYDAHGVSFTIKAEDFAKFDAAGEGVSISTEVQDTNLTDGASLSTRNDWTTNSTTTNTVKITNGVSVKVSENTDLETATKITLNFSTGTVTIKVEDTNAGTVLVSDDITQTTAFTALTTYDNSGIEFTFTNALTNGATVGAISFDLTGDTVETNASSEVIDNSLSFQIGANESQSMSLSLDDMRSQSLGLSSLTAGVDGEAGYRSDMTVNNGTDNTSTEYGLDVSSFEAAGSAITKIDEALEKVSEQRSKLGAVQNRLEHTIANLDTSAENLQASESRVRDVDMAKEMMEFTKNNILQQAAQSMLAQANQAPQGVLQLLR